MAHTTLEHIKSGNILDHFVDGAKTLPDRLLVGAEGINEWDIVMTVGGAVVGVVAMLTG